MMSKNDFYSDGSDVETAPNHQSQSDDLQQLKRLQSLPPVQDTAQNNKITKKRKSKETGTSKRQKKSKEEIEFEKNQKKLQQIELRNKKPGECLKHMLVIFDSNLASLSCGKAAAVAVKEAGVRCEEDGQQAIPYMMTFWRSVTTFKESQPMKIETEMKDVIEDQIIIYVPKEDFVSLVYCQNFSSTSGDQQLNLESFVSNCGSMVGPNVRLTFVVVKLFDYLKSLKTSKTKRNDHWKVYDVMIEQATLCAELKYHCHIKFVDSDAEFAKTVLCYTKSIAECPYKRERKTQSNMGSLYIESGKGAAKLGPAHAWRLQLGTFKNVSADVASAIAKEYPTPRSLIEAYQSCPTTKQAETLLEPIMIRRGAGVTSTSRRVGPELSRRVHTLMTSRDGSALIT